jgi:hypothetical protein
VIADQYWLPNFASWRENNPSLRRVFFGAGSDLQRAYPVVKNQALIAPVNCNSYIAFAVHGSRASPRTACALTVHPELVEGFFELRREPTVTVPYIAGEELEKLARDIIVQPPEVIERMKKLLGN